MMTIEKNGRVVSAMIMDEPVNGVLGMVQCAIPGCHANAYVSGDPALPAPGEQIEDFAVQHDCDPSRFPVEPDEDDENDDEAGDEMPPARRPANENRTDISPAMREAAEWEPLDPARKMWGVINVEDTTAHPLAMFIHEEDAKAWIAQLTTDSDDVAYRGNPHYLSALPVRKISGELWNSYEPVPASEDQAV